MLPLFQLAMRVQSYLTTSKGPKSALPLVIGQARSSADSLGSPHSLIWQEEQEAQGRFAARRLSVYAGKWWQNTHSGTLVCREEP